jgi:hypothetical protein
MSFTYSEGLAMSWSLLLQVLPPWWADLDFPKAERPKIKFKEIT